MPLSNSKRSYIAGSIFCVTAVSFVAVMLLLATFE
jgi:hypothetical protein